LWENKERGKKERYRSLSGEGERSWGFPNEYLYHHNDDQGGRSIKARERGSESQRLFYRTGNAAIAWITQGLTKPSGRTKNLFISTLQTDTALRKGDGQKKRPKKRRRVMRANRNHS